MLLKLFLTVYTKWCMIYMWYVGLILKINISNNKIALFSSFLCWFSWLHALRWSTQSQNTFKMTVFCNNYPQNLHFHPKVMFKMHWQSTHTIRNEHHNFMIANKKPQIARHATHVTRHMVNFSFWALGNLIVILNWWSRGLLLQ